jgi:hypothetical protein
VLEQEAQVFQLGELGALKQNIQEPKPGELVEETQVSQQEEQKTREWWHCILEPKREEQAWKPHWQACLLGILVPWKWVSKPGSQEPWSRESMQGIRSWQSRRGFHRP